MAGRLHLARDPFEGTGAYRRRVRIGLEGAFALALAIGACGITAAMWVRTIAPTFGAGLIF